MPPKTTTAAEVKSELKTIGNFVSNIGKQYGGAVISDIAAALPVRSGSQQQPDGKLCQSCRKLDLIRLFNDMVPESAMDERILVGTYDEIVARSYCPFCRLVLSAVNNSLREPIKPGYRTPEGEAICCLLRRRKASVRFLWQRNLKIELRSMPTKGIFSKSRLNLNLGLENDMRTDNKFLDGIVQDCDAEIIVHNDSAVKYPFPVPLPEGDKNNYSSIGDPRWGLRASHKMGWWLDPIQLLGCTPEPTFDIKKMLNWHKSCTSCSNIDITSYVPPSFVAVPGMLLIDTTTMNLVPAPERAAYVALSYVWGVLNDPFKATKANKSRLMAQGGLLDVVLPRTIREALEVVKAIGFRYFWVDSICIIQDDLDVLMVQIKSMDTIYEGASLTLVAAGGESADDALSTSRIQIHTEVFGDLKLMARNRPLEAALIQSTWNTRAWCYQEKILSGKMLVFTNGEVYYDCSHLRWCESMESADSQRELSASLKNVLNPATKMEITNEKNTNVEGLSDVELAQNLNIHSMWNLLKFVLEEYTLRNITNENDVLSAVWGVLKSMSPRLTNMVGGCHTPFLIYMMVWQPAGSHKRRSITQVPYPSWSWIGWVGTKRFPELYELEHTSRITIITSWYFRDCRSGQSANLLKDVVKFFHPLLEEKTNLDRVGQEEIIAKAKDLTTDQIDQLQEAEVILLKLPSGAYVYALKSECELTEKENDDRSSLATHDMPDNGVLQFWTESAFFTISEPQVKPALPTTDEHLTTSFKIVDSKDRWIGIVELPSAFPTKGEKYEFLIISANLVANTLEKEGKLHNMPAVRKIKAQVRLMGEPIHTAVYFYDVLLIEWRYGVAYRVGLGSIYYKDWESAGAVETLVTLG